jgi:hypothetical protein
MRSSEDFSFVAESRLGVPEAGDWALAGRPSKHAARQSAKLKGGIVIT